MIDTALVGLDASGVISAAEFGELNSLPFADLLPGPARSSADSALVDGVRRSLIETGYMSLRQVTVTVHEAVVSLEGQVRSYHLVQLAQSVAQRVHGVARVVNLVEVANGC
jgi:osmotically-inducible protein OsmY